MTTDLLTSLCLDSRVLSSMQRGNLSAVTRRCHTYNLDTIWEFFSDFRHQTLGYLNGNRYFLTLKGLWQINARFGMKVWNLGPILVNCFTNDSKQKVSQMKVVLLNSYSSMKLFVGRIRMIFDIKIYFECQNFAIFTARFIIRRWSVKDLLK